MIKKIFCLIVLVLIFNTTTKAQIPGVKYNKVDGISNSQVTASLVCDANYSAKQFNINFIDVSGMSGDFSQQIMSSAVTSAVTTTVYYSLGMQNLSYAFASGVALQIFSPWTVLFDAAEAFAAQSNTQARFYVFYVPVDGNYTILCNLKGDLDQPRNRVRLYDNAGNLYIDYNNQLSSDTTASFSVYLKAGPYSTVVGLGSGTSVLLHTA